MSVDYSCYVIIGAELDLEKVLYTKEVTRYRETDGKPYQKKIDDGYGWRFFGKELTADEFDDFECNINKSNIKQYSGYDIRVLGKKIVELEANQLIEFNESDYTNEIELVKSEFKKLGLPEDIVKLVVLFSVY